MPRIRVKKTIIAGDAPQTSLDGLEYTVLLHRQIEITRIEASGA